MTIIPDPKPAHTRMRTLRCLLAVCALVAGLAEPSKPARAQAAFGGGVLGPGSATAGAPPTSRPPASSHPAALPGTKTERIEPAPPDRAPSDMAPNEALFDGINRGDMASVKDAISRGAELNARNILGLTPIDLSVDLGRNDITFLLLSLRGADSSTSGPPVPAGKNARSILQTAGKADSKAARAAAKTTDARSARPAVPPAPATPKLFANDGGAPVPSAGFLGFDARR